MSTCGFPPIEMYIERRLLCVFGGNKLGRYRNIIINKTGKIKISHISTSAIRLQTGIRYNDIMCLELIDQCEGKGQNGGPPVYHQEFVRGVNV